MKTTPPTETADSHAPSAIARANGARPYRRLLKVALALFALAAGSYFVYRQAQRRALANQVRQLFAAGRYNDARTPLGRWSRLEPGAGEPAYYRAWLALVDDQPRAVIEAVDLARAQGFDANRLECLAAIYQARAKRYTLAEPVLEAAYQARTPPQALVAKELARIYLSTYRLDRAAAAIDRWRELAPTDPLPYLWRNEIGTRTQAEHSVMIQNDRAALELDPNLDQARLELASELSKERRFDEAEPEYQAYLKRNPGNAEALIGLGRNAFQQGDLEAALRYYEQALKTDPRQPEALKELAQADLRMGRFASSRDRFKILIELDPFDYELRYSYAQALRRLGDEAGFRRENAAASRLRKENDEITQLRFDLLKAPDNQEIRFAVARWMLEHGHTAEGLKWTNEILRVNPNHAGTHRILADHYARTGDAGLANYHRLLAGPKP